MAPRVEKKPEEKKPLQFIFTDRKESVVEAPIVPRVFHMSYERRRDRDGRCEWC
jgi:hypothetical protein